MSLLQGDWISPIKIVLGLAVTEFMWGIRLTLQTLADSSCNAVILCRLY